MPALAVAWWICFLITITTLPVGLIRLVAIGPGGFERSRTMKVSAAFAVGLGGAALLATIVLGLVLLGK